ncbi:MAG TPA: alkaline phosphatase PhoX [Pyrinomonadaceae bacterium]
MDRRKFLQNSAIFGGALAAMGPFQALGARTLARLPLAQSPGYGPLVNKGDLWLPAEFNYQIVSVQGKTMSDGQPTPGIFDGMAAFPGHAGTTVLIRNHENRERAGEQKVVVPVELQYDPAMFGGNTKLEVRREKAGTDPATGQQLYSYEVVRDFAILGGTSTNCAGGLRSPHIWITCEEVVKGPLGAGASFSPKKHGYIFEIDARADGPVPAVPVPQAGRRAHEAAFEHAGIVYMTEDRGVVADAQTQKRLLGSCFYRYVPKPRGNRPLAETSGPLQALKLRDEFHANMDAGRTVGLPYPVEWVDVPEPDHDDDTDNRRDRAPGFTPNRVQAQDRGAAFFDRLEGMWVERGKVYFDATTGGAADLGQVWEYDPGRETLTLIFESNSPAELQNPDNVVVVPRTGDIFLQEDGDGEQYVRGVTVDGQIYDFARTATNETEFCGGCFSPDGETFYLNQQGERGSLPDGPPDGRAVTYAIYGPFEKRSGSNGKNLGHGRKR